MISSITSIYSNLWQRYAELLIDYSLEVQPDQYVLVKGISTAKPLLLEIYRTLLQRGAWPIMDIALPEMEEVFYQNAMDHHLDQMSKITEHIVNNISSRIITYAQDNTRTLSSVEPSKLARFSANNNQISTSHVPNNQKSVICSYPTVGIAQEAGMSTDEYWDFMVRALHLDRQEPVAVWRERNKRQNLIVEELNKAKIVRIIAPETDITLGVEGRTWVSGHGKRNMPCGEIMTSPIEDSAEGHIYFPLPTSLRGYLISGIRLRFQQGKVIEASAEIGDEYLQNELNTDAGSRFLGEIGIGTNYQIQRPTGSMLFDEKIGGTVHLAIGNSFAWAGGRNISAIHRDMLCELRGGGQIWLDNQLLQENGRFINHDLNL